MTTHLLACCYSVHFEFESPPLFTFELLDMKQMIHSLATSIEEQETKTGKKAFNFEQVNGQREITQSDIRNTLITNTCTCIHSISTCHSTVHQMKI